MTRNGRCESFSVFAFVLDDDVVVAIHRNRRMKKRVTKMNFPVDCLRYVPSSGLVDALSLNKWILTRSPQPEQSISRRKRDLAPSAYHCRTDDVTSSFCHPSFVNCTFLVALISVF